jgi:hypothetical protein
MATIVTTRFNEATWQENKQYRERHHHECIYSVPKKPSEQIEDNDVLFVMEMNNSTNKIEGIGLIRNKVQIYRYPVYKDNNFNRFCYIGKYHITRDYIKEYNESFLETIETMLFKGKSHFKRGSGMTTLTDKMKRKTEMDLYKEIKDMFCKKYKKEEIYKEDRTVD